MKKLIISSALLLAATISSYAQDTTATNYTFFELGSGVNFQLNDGAYKFKLSGMLQPYMAFENQGDLDTEYFLNSKRTYLNFGGSAAKEKVNFFFQMNFSQTNPLLDAWINFNPVSSFNITVGQKQTMTNNREMLVMEDRLQYPDRSLLSTTFSSNGREFGLFLDYTLNFGNVAVIPQAALTSGDGVNSFGSDSRDVDLGGVKYGGRIDVYPLGQFTEGNRNQIEDLAHEPTPKLVIGGAGSYNDGASNSVGEGHADFILYNAAGEAQLPDYRQLYFDVLFKFKGFSALGEYVVATATNLDGTYTDPTGTALLMPTEISQYLALGTSWNAQVGYICKRGYGLDFRYTSVTPEFGENPNSVVSETTGWTIGGSKYFKGNALKIQAAISSFENKELDENTLLGQLLFQIIF